MSSIDWLEVEIVGAQEQFPYLEVALIELSFPGWVDLSEGSVESRYKVYLPKEGAWGTRLQRLIEEAKALQLAVAPGAEIRDEDWAENWKKFYHPLEVGRSLVICPSWEEFQAQPHQKIVILDPGSAFGTGYHPTTQLCLEMLESHLMSLDAGALRVLDLGTGSGILAIAAWMLGAKRLWAVDDDPVAVKVARENAEINGVPFCAQGDLESSGLRLSESSGPLPEVAFDLVVANLIAATLIELAARLARELRPGGHLIVGGVIDLRHEDVRAALTEQGLVWIEDGIREGWYSMHFSLPR